MTLPVDEKGGNPHDDRTLFWASLRLEHTSAICYGFGGLTNGESAVNSSARD